MKILQLVAENFKRLTVVEITPEGNLIKIAGENANGKTSVLDAIMAALGGKTALPDKPVRVGAETARIQLTLGEGEKINLIVERTFTGNNSYLHLRTEDGAKYPKPQEMLNDILGALTFDPLDFMRQKEADQFETLRQLVKVPVDLDELDRIRKENHDERLEVGRKLKELKAQADAIEILEDIPEAPIALGPIMERLTRAGQHNAEIQQAQQVVDAARRAAEDSEHKVEHLRRELADAQAKAAQAAAHFKELSARKIDAPVDPTKIRAEYEEAQRLNAIVETSRKRDALRAQALAEAAKVEDLTNTIKAIDEEKRDALARADMPIEGLSFGEGVVTFNGLPMSQASDAEQLKVSTAIAAALNPTLRVIRIRDGSLLDKKSMKWLAKFADEKDMQIWCEIVGDGGAGAIIIQDGHVAGAAQPE